MTYNPAEDFDIHRVAAQHGIDWRFLKAIRQKENGGPGREFGVLDEGANDWAHQADDSARTVRHTVGRYWKNLDRDPWDDKEGNYTLDFLSYFSQGGPGYPGYSPVGAPNDPTGLNKNDLRNLTEFYFRACGRAA